MIEITIILDYFDICFVLVGIKLQQIAKKKIEKLFTFFQFLHIFLPIIFQPIVIGIVLQITFEKITCVSGILNFFYLNDSFFFGFETPHGPYLTVIVNIGDATTLRTSAILDLSIFWRQGTIIGGRYHRMGKQAADHSQNFVSVTRNDLFVCLLNHLPIFVEILLLRQKQTQRLSGGKK